MTRWHDEDAQETIIVEDLTVLLETDRAILVTDKDGDIEVWLPKSQLGAYPKLAQTGDVEMPRWLADREDLA